MLLVPFGVALIERGPGKGNPLLEATILLSLVCSTYYGGCGILTGAVPNLVVAGRLEEVTGRVLFWGEWMQWMFPVIGLVRTALCVGVVWLLFARRLDPSAWGPEPASSVPSLDSSQRRMLGILLSGVALWATDTLHHLPPVYVGLGLVFACVLPRWGPLRFSQIPQANLPFPFLPGCALRDRNHPAAERLHRVCPGLHAFPGRHRVATGSGAAPGDNRRSASSGFPDGHRRSGRRGDANHARTRKPSRTFTCGRGHECRHGHDPRFPSVSVRPVHGRPWVRAFHDGNSSSPA